MNKKIMIAFALFTLLTSGLFSTSALAKEIQNESAGSALSIVPSEVGIDAPSQLDQPLSSSPTKPVDITVKFKLNIGNFAKRLFFNRRIGRLILFGPSYVFKFLTKNPQATIDLSTECPDWCTATINPKNISLGISNEFQEATVELTVFIKLNKTEIAPALELNEIKVKAEFKGFGGIKASSNETSISFMPAYTPILEYYVEKEVNISSTNETSIPINVTNSGNGETKIEIEIENTPANWTISTNPENITIPVNETKQVNLVIIPTKSFKNETINIKIKSKSTYSETEIDEKYLEGETVSFSIKIINTQPSEEEKLPLFEILLAGIVIIILVSIIAMIMVRKKKQK